MNELKKNYDIIIAIPREDVVTVAPAEKNPAEDAATPTPVEEKPAEKFRIDLQNFFENCYTKLSQRKGNMGPRKSEVRGRNKEISENEVYK